MIEIHRSEDRGTSRYDWLNAKHSFSFGRYYDPQRMGFGPLRVINEDVVAPAKGFDTHGHKDMEIITYILEGALEHKDSLGTGSVIKPGDVQKMSAGTGILHSEFNHSPAEPVHLLQIWILPDKDGHAPGYQQTNFSTQRQAGKLTLLASPDGRANSISVHQDAELHVLDLNAGMTFELPVETGRMIWVQVARGSSIRLNNQPLKQGDGVSIKAELKLSFENSGSDQAELLIFNLRAE